MTRTSVRVSRPRAVFTLIAAVLLGAVGGLLLNAGIGPFGERTTVPIFIAGENDRQNARISLQEGFSPVVKAAIPAVVNISSARIVRSPERGQSPFFNDPFFREFFGPQFQVPRERREQSLGSGVIVSPEGYILTNDHVVSGATDIKVFLSDKRELRAKTVGNDPQTDIAVLKVEEKGLRSLTLGDSNKVEIGDFALAIGNPFGIGQTVTMGIVGATGRGGLGIEDYEDFIQTDAAINPGNSGGALINARGELIGINTAIISRTGGNQGIGFAVPINMARYVMDQIIKTGKVSRGWIGVTIQDVTPALASSFGLKETRGALVGEVSPDSPASRAGLASGDIILQINGEPVVDTRSLRLKVAQAGPGTSVNLKIWRNGKEQSVSMTLGELPTEIAQGTRQQQGRSEGLEGLALDELTPQIARQLGIPATTRGVLVTEVTPGTAAEEAGLRRGDIIQEVNRKPINNVAEFYRAVRDGGDKTILLLVNRGGSSLYLALEQ